MMEFPYKTVGIKPKVSQPGIEELIRGVARWLKERGSRTICLEEGIHVAEVEPVTRDQFKRDADLILVLGGDGTFLAAGRLALARGVPILGVNLGRLGFLTEITVAELFPALEKIQTNEVGVEIRPLLQAKTKLGGKVLFEGHVINDAVVAKSGIARLLDIEAHVDQNFLASFKADGLIISTPTGSTAYSLAAGGPIVFPTLDAIVMTPICPHSLNQRPLVIPDNFTISLQMQPPLENVNLTLDGQVVRPLQDGECVEIAKSAHRLQLIKSPFKSYFDILKSKLRWAES